MSVSWKFERTLSATEYSQSGIGCLHMSSMLKLSQRSRIASTTVADGAIKAFASTPVINK